MSEEVVIGLGYFFARPLPPEEFDALLAPRLPVADPHPAVAD